jgi:para-nitrobenzyl esterase
MSDLPAFVSHRPRRCAWVAFVAALASAALSACGDDDEGSGTDAGSVTPGVDAASGDGPVDGLRIELSTGVLEGEYAQLPEGVSGGEARRFLGIPYAKPPLGALRWKAPGPAEAWDGVLKATEFVAGCPQQQDQGAPASDNEDCLYLNVWSPAPAPRAAPVMVWIHGGGNFSGGTGLSVPSTRQLWYDGAVFAAARGVVVVTIQYRLGPLGFFAHPALAAEGEPTGNQGLQDQRMALEWVRDHIARFGGDPTRVTIFGESAGSADVCYHVASPRSAGLFHGAIGQSGGCTIRSVGAEQTPASVADSLVAYGEALGCTEGDGQLECMREAPVAAILDNAMQPAPGSGAVESPTWSFQAVIDGEDGFLPDTLSELFDRGEVNRVPTIDAANHE